MRTSRLVLRLVLAGGLLYLAWAKFDGFAGSSTLAVAKEPYLLAAALEVGIAVLLLIPRTSALAARLLAFGFLGAAFASLLIDFGPKNTCHCLGATPTPRAIALMVQGAIVVLAGFVLVLDPQVREADRVHRAA